MLLIDGKLSQLDGILLVIGFACFVLWAIWQAKRQPGDDDSPPGMSTGKAWLTLAIAMAVLIGSSRLLVWGATSVAHAFGVSELIIGLTIVAIGSSLPELAASIAAARRGQPEMAVGNVLGSNVFNTLAVLCVPALVSAPHLQADAVSRDLPIMAAFTALLLYIVFRKRHLLYRIEGAGLVLCFLGYLAWLGLASAT